MTATENHCAFVAATPLPVLAANLLPSATCSRFRTGRVSDATGTGALGRRASASASVVMQADDTSASDGAQGFAKKPAKAPSSAGSQRRQEASDRYDAMAASGMPEYSVWMRLKEGGTSGDEEQMPWLPVGCISVPRSSQVADALFDTEEDLMQGALRLYPNLKKEPRENIEFGYQLREFDDEDIKVAVRSPSSGWQAALTNFFRSIQNPINSSK